jgi:hypothetical protein
MTAPPNHNGNLQVSNGEVQRNAPRAQPLIWHETFFRGHGRDQQCGDTRDHTICLDQEDSLQDPIITTDSEEEVVIPNSEVIIVCTDTPHPVVT